MAKSAFDIALYRSRGEHGSLPDGCYREEKRTV